MSLNSKIITALSNNHFVVKIANSFVSTENCVDCTVEVHRIAENFCKQIDENMIFAEKTFADCLLLPCQRMPRPQILQRKLLQIATKPQNSRKFSLLKVSHYTVYFLPTCRTSQSLPYNEQHMSNKCHVSLSN